MPKLQTPPGRGRSLIAAIVLSTCAGGAAAAQPALQHWHCTNAASGTNWTVVVDPAAGRVDRFPATITKNWISWRDPAQGSFDLDRSSGDLQMRNASSTGGYFMNYRCRRE